MSMPGAALPHIVHEPHEPRTIPPEAAEAATSAVERRANAAKELLRRHADLVEASPAGDPIRRGEIVLVSPSADTLAAAEKLGLRLLRQEQWPGLGLGEVVMSAPAGLGTARALQQLQGMAADAVMDFNHIYLPGGETTPGNGRSPAWGPRGPMRVGLIDGGVAQNHPALRPVGIERFGCDGETISSEHGTAVASLLVGHADGRFQGAAPKAKLYAADIYCGHPDGGAAEDLVRALAWMAREGVPVINVSLVGPPNRLLAQGIAALVRRGHLVVAAVGNDGPAAPPLFPASYPGVVGVTGVTPQRRVLPEAAQGPQVMWAAPGSELAVASREGSGYTVARGTSFAAPLVAGLLAGELCEPDSAAAAAALERLAARAADLGAQASDPKFGRGLVGEALRIPPDSVRAQAAR